MILLRFIVCLPKFYRYTKNTLVTSLTPTKRIKLLKNVQIFFIDAPENDEISRSHSH